MASPDFVRVAQDGRGFTLRGSPFHFCGANTYYCMTRAAEPSLRHEVTEVLDAMAATGLTVLRTWAFNDGEAQWNALQPRPGEFNDHVFEGLDFVLAEARRRGILVILTLVNYWGDYGGMPQYAKWSAAARGADPGCAKAEHFYTDPWAQNIFRNYLATLTARVNSFTGIAYRDDPTIMAWSLANEPRCQGDYSGATLQGWLDETAESLKSLDPNHLVTYSSEGFLGSSTPDLIQDNPFDGLATGCDWARNSAGRHIDFASFHLWPDNWLKDKDDAAQLRFARRWVNCHVDAAATIGKPVVLAEFGKKGGGPAREEFYRKVLARAADHMAARRGLGGTLIRAACCRAHADGPVLILTSKSPSDRAAAHPGGSVAAGSGDGRVGCAALQQQVAKESAAAAALPRPGAAVRRIPAPTPQQSPAASPQKAAASAASQGQPAQGLGTPPQRPAAAAVNTPLARPCSNARDHAEDCCAAAAGVQAADGGSAAPGSNGPADGEAAAPALAAADVKQHHCHDAAEPPSEQDAQQHAEAAQAAGWAAADAAALAHDDLSGHEDLEDPALAVVREHAAALAAGAAERTDSSCSIM